MKTKPWESSVPQIPKAKNRKRLFRRWVKIKDTKTYIHWDVVGHKWLTPREITFYSLLDNCRLEEISESDLLNYAKEHFPLDSAEWLMHK